MPSPRAPHLAEPELTYVTDATFEDFHAAIARGFQEEYHSELLRPRPQGLRHERMFGFTVGDRWVSTCGDFERQLTVPGGASGADRGASRSSRCTLPTDAAAC